MSEKSDYPPPGGNPPSYSAQDPSGQQGYPPQQIHPVKQDSSPQQGYPLQQTHLVQQGHPQQQGYPPQAYPPQPPVTNVIIRQGHVQPNDYLAFAIIVTICCCLPLGIVAIIKSTEVRSRFAAGDYQGADEASRDARKWSIAALIFGISISLTVVLFYVVIWVVFAASAASAASSVPKYDYHDVSKLFHD